MRMLYARVYSGTTGRMHESVRGPSRLRSVTGWSRALPIICSARSVAVPPRLAPRAHDRLAPRLAYATVHFTSPLHSAPLDTGRALPEGDGDGDGDGQIPYTCTSTVHVYSYSTLCTARHALLVHSAECIGAARGALIRFGRRGAATAHRPRRIITWSGAVRGLISNLEPSGTGTGTGTVTER